LKTKLIEVNGGSYQLRKMDPGAGSFIYLRMLGAWLAAAQDQTQRQQYEADAEAPKPTDEEKARLLISGSIMRGLSFEDTQFAQKAAWRCVSQRTMIKDQEAYIPIMSDDGRWADQVLAEDAATLHKLAVESLVFSLQPFFADSGSSSA
jgi:hypothetical protein